MIADAPQERRAAGPVWRAAALFALLTIVLAYPLSVNPGSTVLANNPDNHLFIWTLAWDVHALSTKPLSIFESNIYAPERLTLAYSENLIGSAFVAAPVLWTTGNGVLAMNVVALLSCFLCGLGAFVLGRRLGLSDTAAVLCGVIFAFAPPRFFRMSQIHLTTVQWIPFALASLHAYFEGGSKRDLRWAAAFASLQALTTGHGAVFLGLAGGLLVIWKLALGEPLAIARRVRDVGLTGVLLLVPAVLVFIPYRLVQVDKGLRRTLENWAATPESFLASPSRLHTLVLDHVAPHVNEVASAFLFPGYLPILLAIAAIWWRRDDPSRRWMAVLKPVALLTTVAAVCALAFSIIVTMHGAQRLRVGSIVILSARTPLRAWLACAAIVALRLALVGWVPFPRWDGLRKWRDALIAQPFPRSVTAFYLLVTIVCVLLAVGPPISLWPVVYWLPGFNFIRGPSRFMILATLGFAVLAALGFERLSASLGARARAWAATALGCALLIEFAAVPLHVVPYGVSIPAADQWLALQPKPFVVAELPVGGERNQTTFMLHSMAHWQKTIHGYSGIRPALHEQLYVDMRSFPDERSLQGLEALGVTYVVVHTDMYGPGQWPLVEDRIKAFEPRLHLSHTAQGGQVYVLNPGGLPGQPARGAR